MPTMTRRPRSAAAVLAGIVLCAVFTPVAAEGPAVDDPTNTRAKRPHVALVYVKDYEINLGGLERSHAFDIHKYQKIRRRLVQDGLAAERDFFPPQELSREQILLVHTPAFLQNLKEPKTVAEYLEAPVARLVPAPLLDAGILRAFRYASGGTILAARLALEHGIAVNLGGGYHHAKPGAGEGFCVYADMPIAIRALQREKKIARVLVVDLDVHQGNGTDVCLKGDDSVFTFDMHQGNIYPIPKEKSSLDIELEPGTGDAAYQNTLEKALPGAIDRARPDLVFFQAGCDPLRGDPLASLALSPEGIVARDAYVIDACAKRGLPVVMVLGGGYSPQAWSVQAASIARSVKTYGLVRRPPGEPEKDKGKLPWPSKLK
jgi:histone deacetylase 11